MGGLLILRADAGARMGAGHVMRSLALAHAWRERGGEAAFVSRLPDALAQRVQTDGFALTRLPLAASETEEIETLKACAAGTGRLWVALDGYGFSPGYSSALRTFARVLSVDDFGTGAPADADIYLDQNLDGGRAGGYPEGSPALLGPRYALLRPEFHAAPATPSAQSCERVLITMGGGDQIALASELLGLLARALPGTPAFSVVGGFSHGLEALEQRARGVGARLDIQTNVQNMAESMREVDLAISAAGSTVWELACLGIPTVVLPLAANQQPVAQSLKRRGWPACAHTPDGDIRPALREVAELARGLACDSALRLRLSAEGKALIDGRGAPRVVEAMCALDTPLPDTLAISPATEADCEEVWRLSCLPSVRANSLCTEPIPWGEHQRWYARQMKRSDQVFRLVRLGGLLAGQIRFARQNEAAIVHFSVATAFRGRGLGKRLLAETWQEACRLLGVSRVRGLVRNDNAPSSACFISAGFSPIGVETLDGREVTTFERTRT